MAAPLTPAIAIALDRGFSGACCTYWVYFFLSKPLVVMLFMVPSFDRSLVGSSSNRDQSRIPELFCPTRTPLYFFMEVLLFFPIDLIRYTVMLTGEHLLGWNSHRTPSQPFDHEQTMTVLKKKLPYLRRNCRASLKKMLPSVSKIALKNVQMTSSPVNIRQLKESCPAI